MKAGKTLRLALPHVGVALLTISFVTLLPTGLYYAFAIYCGVTDGDFGGPLNFILIPVVFFCLGVALAALVTVPTSIVLHWFWHRRNRGDMH